METLLLHRQMYRLSPADFQQTLAELADLLEVEHLLRVQVRKLSLGERMKLELLAALLHRPKVLFLDEPTIGLDPVGAREVRAMIASLTEAGKTVLLTTHYMFEADSLCDRIAVIANGRIVAEGTPAELKDHVADSTVVEVEVFGVDEADVLRLRDLPGVTSVSVEERDQAQVLLVQSAKGLELTQTLLRALEGARIGRVGAREPTLEDAYVALVSDDP